MIRTLLLTVGAAAMIVTGGAAAFAQVQDSEIIVTGRKKAEALSDVAASVVAVPGIELQEKGIVDLELLQNTIPNFRYTTAVGASDNLFIRGLGTVGSGPHFEPGVGQQLNGVVYSRSRFGRAGLIDTAQVEVLRGPQGAVTGRNTSLGLVNIVPNKPTDEFAATVFGRYDFADNDGYQIEGVISGPVTNGVRGRLAANYKDQDGFIDNQVTGETTQTKDDWTVRGILDFDISERGNIELFGQYVDAQRDGKAREIVACSASALADPLIGNGDCSLDRRNSNQAVLDAFDNQEFPERFDIDLYTLIGTVNYNLSDAVTLTSTTSYTDYTITDVIDTDLSPLGRLTSSAPRSLVIFNAEDFTQFTQEIEFSGNLNERLGYIVGGLYNSYDVDFVQNSNTEGFGPPPYRPVNRHQFGNQKNDGYSLYADLTYDLNDQFTVNGGMRYSSEDRAARAGQILTRTGTSLMVSNFPGNGPGPNCLGRSGLFSCSMFPVIPSFNDGTLLDAASGLNPREALFETNVVPEGPLFEVNDDDLTWNANVQYRPDDDNMLYVSAATGFKAGGFNMVSSLSQKALEDNFSFGPEDTLNLEIGGRHTKYTEQGYLNFNWTVFRMDINNQQVSSLDPVNVAQVVQATAEARTQGVEMDGGWTHGDFRLKFDLAYTDAEYTDFTGATCYSGQTEAGGCVGGVQDRTGTPLVQAPEWQGGVNVQGDLSVGNGLTLTPFVEIRYVGEHFTDTELRPIAVNDEYVQINARLTLADLDDTWQLALVGTNLGDEVHQGFFDETSSIPGGAFAFPNPGRQIALTARYNFR
ncbi:MAG: TonB-dependent receptor [Hyphomonadaceae bacterium]|nr:TonB-dependent receptor [Hyphomonadaceae bacterium]